LAQPLLRSFQALGWVLLAAWVALAFMDFPAAYGQSGGKPASFPEGGRNPFLLPAGIRPLSPEAGIPARKEASAPAKKEPEGIQDRQTRPKESWPFALKAILIGERIRLAAIDQWIVTVGDPVHDERILEIHPDQVVLAKGEKRRTLFLSQSLVRLRVEEPKAGEAP
jgi:hypothetical protein